MQEMYKICIFFYYKQKTAYEMRISDWSSDVCSSDLPKPPRKAPPRQNSQKSPRKTATQEIAPQAMPSRPPKVKPARRPKRPISSEAGMVIAAVAMNCSDSGRVASAGVGARPGREGGGGGERGQGRGEEGGRGKR